MCGGACTAQGSAGQQARNQHKTECPTCCVHAAPCAVQRMFRIKRSRCSLAWHHGVVSCLHRSEPYNQSCNSSAHPQRPAHLQIHKERHACNQQPPRQRQQCSGCCYGPHLATRQHAANNVCQHARVEQHLGAGRGRRRHAAKQTGQVGWHAMGWQALQNNT